MMKFTHSFRLCIRIFAGCKAACSLHKVYRMNTAKLHAHGFRTPLCFSGSHFEAQKLYNPDRNILLTESLVFLDIIPCGALKVSGRFGVTCRFHLWGRGISQP